MNVILVHGMGRTPVSTMLLAIRLRAAGFKPYCFAYLATVERWESCTHRLETMLVKHSAKQDYILIGHSLGTVLCRAVLPRLKYPPKACFFLASPTQACLLAKKFAPHLGYRLLAGEMGQLLANQSFMDTLPVPTVPTKIYAGTNGFYGKCSPFKNEPNDGILMVKETVLPAIPMQILPLTHTYIMTSRYIAEDIVRIATSSSISAACSESI
jgi:hypothetical protein